MGEKVMESMWEVRGAAGALGVSSWVDGCSANAVLSGSVVMASEVRRIRLRDFMVARLVNL